MNENKKNTEYIVDDNETSEELLLDLSDEELEQKYNKAFGKTN